MKNGVTSLSELPEGWAWTTVGEIYDIVGGGTPSTAVAEYWEGDIPWITSADILGLRDIRPRRQITRQAIEGSATHLVPAGSLIIVTRVGLGKIALTTIPICFSQDSQALVCGNVSLFPDYSLYCLSEIIQVFRYKHRGTTINGVTKKQLAELTVPVPPLSEQHHIVAKIEELFTRLDAGVEALKKVKAQLKRYRQAVLKYAFEGKLSEEWRQAHKHELEPASVLLERIKQERQKTTKGKYKELPPLDTSDLPQLPEGWVWTRVEDISFLVTKGSTPTSYNFNYVRQGINFVKVENLKNGRVDKSSILEFIAQDTHDFLKRSQLMNADVLFSIAGTIGKVAIVHGDDLPANTNQAIAIIRCPWQHINPHYLKAVLDSEIARSSIERRPRGVGMNNVSLGDVKNVVLPLPPLREQHQIVEEIERRFSVADETERTIDQGLKQSERLRQSTLKRAFDGKLVPQDPNDEPAERLLERIREDRAKQQATTQPTKVSKKIVTTQEMRLM